MFAIHQRFFSLLFAVSVLCFDGVSMSNFNDLQRLHKHLIEQMDIDIRPVINQSDTLHVDVVPVLTHLHGLDEKNQVLTSTFAMQLSWKYETFTWNSSEFGEADSFIISAGSVWTPDVTYQNAYRENIGVDKRTGSKVTIKNEGMAVWNTGANLQTGCNVDIKKYPFDTQICKIILGKTTYSDSQESLRSVKNKMAIQMTEENNEWLIVDTNIKYITRRPYLTYIEIQIILERRYLYYVLNVIIPVVMLSMMNVFTFKLPSSCGERIGYNISLLLTYVVLLNMISDSVPRVSKYVSYIQLYIVTQFSMAIIISILSITVVRMENDKYQTKVPQFVSLLFRKFLRCSKNVRQVDVTNEEKDGGLQLEGQKDLDIGDRTGTVMKETVSSKNPTLVQFLDSICFWTFMTFFVTSTTVCMLVMIL
ncbi:neuronal acetylcholine receptor subunit alpha-6-like [Ruditapes philippinarum]|uniref:neuronal acetylcholine receptor subunit alpha-6-like n=1 Tax=Ruditapes philippinarum TaxID=129788 RepID=UPI00295BD7FA|nr:neuronal acetylcholine receptor subunit alpha-6-like [Ruditapes philippinarum]